MTGVAPGKRDFGKPSERDPMEIPREKGLGAAVFHP